ncbi:MAG: AMP-binding protein [Myxococcales bacterium]|nr:MAG: AMP-binding protein [Myxococcales bacterium]
MTFGGVERYVQNLERVIDDAEASRMITYERISRAIRELPGLASKLKDVLGAEDLLTSSKVSLEASVSKSDTALIQYTSGTTSKPKGVVISHQALCANTHAIYQSLHMSQDDVGVSWLPMFHDMGLIGVLYTSLCHGFAVHIMTPESFVMQPRSWLELITKVKGTVSAGPNFAYQLCAKRGPADCAIDLSSWRAALNGAEQVQAPTLDQFAQAFSDHGYNPSAMTPVYGMAESTLAICFSAPEHAAQALRIDRQTLEASGKLSISTAADAMNIVSVGKPVTGCSLRVAEPDSDRILGEGQVGEVQTRSSSLMDGYFHNEKASEEALKSGWLHTGDLGFVAGQQLFITGRAKDMIIKGGKNIHPYDIEQVTASIPGVRGSVAAFAASNELSGTDDLVVVAETMQQDPHKRDAIVKSIRGELLASLGIKADQIHLWRVGRIPRTTSGKIQRSRCSALLQEQDKL